MTDLGAPNLSIQLCRRARITVSVRLPTNGMASHHQVKRSTQVRKKRCPRDGEKGPTRPICTWWKPGSGASNVSIGALLWRCTLVICLGMHYLVHSRTFFCRPFQAIPSAWAWAEKWDLPINPNKCACLRREPPSTFSVDLRSRHRPPNYPGHRRPGPRGSPRHDLHRVSPLHRCSEYSKAFAVHGPKILL